MSKTLVCRESILYIMISDMFEKPLMKSIAKLIPLFFVATVSPVLGLTRSQNIPSYGKISDSLLKLHVDGSFIKDSSGKTWRLSGVAAHPAHSLELWKGLQDDDVAWMKSKGFTACRLTLTWNEIETSPGTYNASYLGRYVDNAISLFQKHRIYVILENHITFAGPHWGGPPFPWNGEGIPAFYCDEYPSTVEGLTQFFLDFWANRGPAAEARQALINFWKMLATRYKGLNVVAAYELFNEPDAFPNSDKYIDTFAPQVINLYDNELGPAVRDIDPDTIIIYDGFSYQLSEPIHVDLLITPYITKPRLPNVVWGKSCYDKSWDYSNEDTKILDRHRDELRAIIEKLYKHFVVKLDVPFFALEIGKGLSELNALEWVGDILQLWDVNAENSFSFQWWRYNALPSDWMPRDPETGEDRSVVPIIATYE